MNRPNRNPLEGADVNLTASVRWTRDDRDRVALLVGDAEVDRVLKFIVKAGSREALGYATGRAVFSTMVDLRMYRVYCLLEEGMTLDESERLVALLFKQLTPVRVEPGARHKFGRLVQIV